MTAGTAVRRTGSPAGGIDACGDVPKSKRPRASRMVKAERAALVRACAMRVVARHGIGNASHTLVAAEAEISVATVFFYFPTQVILLEAVLDDVAAFLLNDVIAPFMGSDDSAQARIERILLAFAESIDSHPDVARVWLDWSTAIRHEIWARYLVFHAQACRLFREIVVAGQCADTLRKSVDPDDAARVLVGLGHMIAQMKFAGSPPTQVNHAVHALVQNYIGIAE